MPINATLTAPITTFDQANGCGPWPAALLLLANPLAAFRPVAVGLYVAVPAPVAVAPPILGLPVAV
jgi:hypothetical protein